MNAKKESFYLNNALIMIVVVGVALLLEYLLSPLMTDLFLRTVSIIILALGLHFFLSTSLLEHYQLQEQNLKNLVDETLHELNTPIATIEANLKMLEKSHTDEKSQKRLLRIRGAAKNLSRLYQSIEHSIKSEIDSVEKESFDLTSLIDESIEKFTDIKGAVMIENRTPHITLLTDKNGFGRSFDNLLSNAVKYNKKDGSVMIDYHEGILTITDSGVGIDTKNLFIVFDKAYQENPSTEGFGIGLSIVKAFCDREKIEIKIDTQKDRGTTIMLDIRHLVNV